MARYGWRFDRGQLLQGVQRRGLLGPQKPRNVAAAETGEVGQPIDR